MVEGSTSPAVLLRTLKRIERKAGRRLGRRWGPRQLDIDILDFGGRQIGNPHGRRRRGQLQLPHPEMHRRAFVLLPLREVAPFWRHPRLGLTVSALLARLAPRDRAGVRRLLDSAAITCDKAANEAALGTQGFRSAFLHAWRAFSTERDQRMARVTVEDCVDKVPNRFELVLLAAHRARSIANGSQITVDPDNDKNPVIALREIADKTVPPDDLREGLIHSIQKNVEVDEPEAAAAPSLPQDRRPTLGRDDQSSDTVVDVITEEQLLRGMESLTPTEPSANGGSGRG